MSSVPQAATCSAAGLEPEADDAAGGKRAPLSAEDRLFVPYRKRMTASYHVNEEGVRELRLDYGVKEVSFDEERLFPFGEQLARSPSFLGREAITWAPGYTWDELAPLLETLLDEGIVRRGEEQEADPRGGGLVPSPLPPSICPVARSWSAQECESITSDLGKRPVEIGYLEAILSVYRIAHAALDTDDRQVGEANVFPPGLRLDREAEYRVCQYSGSRYRDERPMNVTALKAMIKHWKPMMKVLHLVRAEVLRRLSAAGGRSRSGAWTVGDLHLLASVVLALPAYQLMKGGGRSPQPPLHPVLSSLFRVTDGIRMTTHEMLFLSAERTRAPGELTSAEELYAFAERNNTFLGDTGVCAGPKAMIDELLAVAIEGAPVEGADDLELAPEVQSLIGELPAAVDYGLLGLQVWGVGRSVWLAMSLAYKALRRVFSEATGTAAERLRDRLDRDWARLDVARIADNHERDVHLDVYRDSYEQPWRALAAPQGSPSFAARVAPVTERPEHAAVTAQLRVLFSARFAEADLGGLTAAHIAELAGILVEYLRSEQAILASVTELTGEINRRLARPAPARPLTVRDLRIAFEMYAGLIGDSPYLFDMLEAELGIYVESTAAAIELVDRKLNPLTVPLPVASSRSPAPRASPLPVTAP
jgi:hypothetical protein